MPARILIVEDNETNLELMSYLLTAFGYEVLSAPDGESACDAVARERPALVLCDIQLPGIDGYEVLRRVRGEPSSREIKLVAVTAFAMVGDRDAVLRAGFDGYISKPIDPGSFVPQVERHLAPAERAAPVVFDEPSATGTGDDERTGRTILVVDDAQTNLDLAVTLFEGCGYRVLCAHGPDEALAMARCTAPDLILSDVVMRSGNGYDFIGRVKADPRLADIPFVFVTSTAATTAERRRGLALGARKYLFRPLEPEQFLAEVVECLAAPSA